MKKIILFLILFIYISCKNDQDVNPIASQSLEPISSGEIIKHTYYTLAYSEENEQAYWVYYQLTPVLIGYSGDADPPCPVMLTPHKDYGSESLND